MIALPVGEFMMGSREDEPGRQAGEGLPRRVTIGKRIAIGRIEVTVEQFERFVAETGITVGSHCRLVVNFDEPGTIRYLREASFREQPGYAITGSHPVSCVSWHDAQAYVAWLKRRTGKPYRLPTESEWEYAARAGTNTNFSFGNDGGDLCAYARFADLNSPFSWRSNCRSDFTAAGTIPAGMLKPNPWGLHDMHGNVSEWVEDCWMVDGSQIPTDGSPVVRPGKCEMGMIRGGSWLSRPLRARSAFRIGAPTARRDQSTGFRVALTLEP
jgi:formylglycine-generating enzyme required for sulfatase activity